MDSSAARQALTDALDNGPRDAPPRIRFRAARAMLRDRAAHAIGASATLPLPDILRLAEAHAITPKLRVLAVLLVHALAVPGLLDTGFPAIQSFLERVLQHALRRAGYDFGASPERKRLALGRLHETLDEHMRPLELSIPTWIYDPPPPNPAA